MAPPIRRLRAAGTPHHSQRFPSRARLGSGTRAPVPPARPGMAGHGGIGNPPAGRAVSQTGRHRTGQASNRAAGVP